MLGFSKQEQRFMLILIFGFAVGLGIQIVKAHQPDVVSAEWALDYDQIMNGFDHLSKEHETTQNIDSDSVKKETLSKKKKFVGKININTANSEELQTLPGIGPATAEKIIDYRASVGAFNKIEEIQKVKGIGPKKFEKIKSFIVVH